MKSPIPGAVVSDGVLTAFGVVNDCVVLASSVGLGGSDVVRCGLSAWEPQQHIMRFKTEFNIN